MTSFRLTTLAALVAAVLAVAVTPATAKDGDAVRVRGACTQASTAKLKLSRDDGRIETEFEVDQNRNGVRWNVTFWRNGVRVAATTATTRAPSGSFEVRRYLAGPSAQIKAVATRAGGERCTARAGV